MAFTSVTHGTGVEVFEQNRALQESAPLSNTHYAILACSEGAKPTQWR